MGAFDSMAGVLMLFGGVHVAGSTQALLGNAVIPVTMALSTFILGSRYRAKQYFGALTIMLGVATVLLPQFLSSPASSSPSSSISPSDDSSSSSPPSSPSPSALGDSPIFTLLFLASVIPQAMSSIYKEKAFTDIDIDVNFLQAWVALWQTIFGILLIPLNTLSILGPNHLPWNELFSALVNGAKCMMGVNSVVEPFCLDKPCDSCEGAWVPLAAYLAFNCCFNIFIVLVIKHGGAALMYIVMTLRLPLVQFAFSRPWIQSPPDSFSKYSLFGLGLILVGLVVYRWSAAHPKHGDDEGEEDVVAVAIGQLDFPHSIHRKKMAHLGRTHHQIRSTLYSRLGVINSPVTPHSPRSLSSRHSSPASKSVNQYSPQHPPIGRPRSSSAQSSRHPHHDMSAII